jgi:glycosyltransferase involved in cell wall biosynthesis
MLRCHGTATVEATHMLSIVIPALNEEKYLPRLLDSLERQTFADFETIVADAGSCDCTTKVAARYGCMVVSGGKPAQGRNEGARHAKAPFVLFLDADVLVEENFLEDLMGRVFQRKLEVASGFVCPDSGKLIDKLLVSGSNLYCYLVQRASPHGSGFYILARKSLHDRIGGFNEQLFMAEDHDYLCRAARLGKFEYLRHPRVIFSMRRFDKEGRGVIIWKYFVLEMYRAFKKEVKREVVPYDFGNY